MNTVGDTQRYTGDYGNTLLFGRQSSGTFNENSDTLKPEELWNIDTKIDDGKPGTGKIWAREGNGFNGVAAVKCTTSANTTDYAGAYNLTNSGSNCGFYVVKFNM